MQKTKRLTKFKLKDQPSEVCEEAVINFILSTKPPGIMPQRVVIVKERILRFWLLSYFSIDANIIRERTSLNRWWNQQALTKTKSKTLSSTWQMKEDFVLDLIGTEIVHVTLKKGLSHLSSTTKYTVCWAFLSMEFKREIVILFRTTMVVHKLLKRSVHKVG